MAGGRFDIFPGRGPRRCDSRRCGPGFTIAELLVASVIMSTALLSVYAIFKRTLEVERTVNSRLTDRAAAEALADHLAGSLAAVLSVGGAPAVECRQDKESKEFELTCMTGPAGVHARQAGQSALQRRRYHWNFAADDKRVGSVEFQARAYAGKAEITPAAEAGAGDEELWAATVPAVVGRRIKRLTVQFKPVRQFADPQEKWQSSWSGDVGAAAIMIRVAVGDQVVEKFIAPRVNAAICQ